MDIFEYLGFKNKYGGSPIYSDYITGSGWYGKYYGKFKEIVSFLNNGRALVHDIERHDLISIDFINEHSIPDYDIGWNDELNRIYRANRINLHDFVGFDIDKYSKCDKIKQIKYMNDYFKETIYNKKLYL